MAVWVSNDGVSLVSVDEGAHTAVYSFIGSWHGNSGGDQIDTIRFDGTGFGWQWGTVKRFDSDLTYYTSLAGHPTLACDTAISWRANVRWVGVGQIYAGFSSFKSTSVTASVSAPSSGSITANSASISCNYFPNTLESTCSAQLQYKRTVDSDWTDFGTPDVTSGYAQQTITKSLTGLTGLTSYDVRLVLTRTTADKTTATGAKSSFQTLPGVPEVTTDGASGVAATSAQLNASIVVNAGTSVNVYWKWGTDNPPTQNQTADVPVSADGGYSIGITGLSGSQTYYAQAYVSFSTPSGSPISGSVINFSTPTDPALEAAEEAHMHIYNYDGTYGAATDIYFTLSSPAATSSDRLVTTAPGGLFAAGDIKISKDGGAFANVANAVSQVSGGNPLYKLTLSASEMQAELAVVQIVDQDGPAFRDQLWVVRTKQRLGQVIVDASNLTDVSAVTYTGQGTGHGLSCVGGATGRDIDGIIAQHFQRVSVCQTNATGTVVKLDASASATNDYYNGSVVMIVDGTGAGQARIITDYDGTSKEATVDTAWATIPTAASVAIIIGGSRAWDLAPDAELSVVPGSTANYGLKVQFLFQRFAFKITQTATLQTWFKANSSTALASRAVDDDGVTQTLAKLT